MMHPRYMRHVRQRAAAQRDYAQGVVDVACASVAAASGPTDSEGKRIGIGTKVLVDGRRGVVDSFEDTGGGVWKVMVKLDNGRVQAYGPGKLRVTSTASMSASRDVACADPPEEWQVTLSVLANPGTKPAQVTGALEAALRGDSTIRQAFKIRVKKAAG